MLLKLMVKQTFVLQCTRTQKKFEISNHEITPSKQSCGYNTTLLLAKQDKDPCKVHVATTQYFTSYILPYMRFFQENVSYIRTRSFSNKKAFQPTSLARLELKLNMSYHQKQRRIKIPQFEKCNMTLTLNSSNQIVYSKPEQNLTDTM